MRNDAPHSSRVKLADLSGHFRENIDVFVCSGSYEERCLSAPRSIKPEQVSLTLVLSNEDVRGNGKANRDILCGHFGSTSKMIEISKSHSLKTGDRLLEQFDDIGQTRPLACLVDITCLTHETLLILYAVLKTCLPKDSKIQFTYTPALEYDPGVNVDQKWLSKGIRDLRSVLGYPGELLPSKKTRLIVLVGFEVDRTVKLIETMEPSFLTLGIGNDPPINDEHKAVNSQKFQKLQKFFPSASTFEFSTASAFEACEAILKISRKHSEDNIVIAPMNTKISTLGAALAVEEQPSIQICYAPASVYNVENYSKPEDYCFVFNLD